MDLTPNPKEVAKNIEKRVKIALKALASANKGKDAEKSYRLGGRHS